MLVVRTTHANISSIERRSIQTLSVLAQTMPGSVIPVIERRQYFDNPGIDFERPLNLAGKKKLRPPSEPQSAFDEKPENFELWKLHSVAFVLTGCVGVILLVISL